MTRKLLIIVCLGLASVFTWVTSASCQDPVSITLQPDTTYQTMVGWEATAQAGQWEFVDLFPKYKDALFDLAVNDLGINRLRVEIYGGVENPTDWHAAFVSGQLSERDWVHVRAAQIINDNDDAFSINPSGFSFSMLDDAIDSVFLPMKQRLQARGEQLYLNVNYVDFRDPPAGSCSECYEHYNYPDEYAELVLATYQHINTKYGFPPDAWEASLEPDNSAWGGGNGLAIGQCIYAGAIRLRENGFTPAFIAPSVSRMENLLPFISGIKQGIKLQGSLTDAQVDQFIRDNMEEYSYHRYKPDDSALPALVADAQAHGIKTAQLEHMGADHNELHTDLKVGGNSAWQQFVLAYPTDDNGAQYFWIDNTNTENPVVNIGSRTKFLRQYFRFIRPGAVRIEAASSDPRFDPVAFISADGTYVVVIKAADGGSFSIRGAAGGRYGIKYTTDAEYDVDLPDVDVAAGQPVEAAIPAHGVVTVYAKN